MIRLLALALALIFPLQASALEFTERKCDGAVIASGVFSIEGAKNFGLLLRKREEEGNPVKTMYIDSPGGSFQSALFMSSEVVDRGISIRVPGDALCISACAYLLLSSPDGRILKNDSMTERVKIHYPYINIGAQMYMREKLLDEFDEWFREMEIVNHYMIGQWLVIANAPPIMGLTMYNNRNHWFNLDEEFLEEFPMFNDKLHLVEELNQCSD